LKIGIVGCGRIAKNHISAAVELGLEVVGLCDIDLNKAQKLKEDFNLKDSIVFESYLEMFLIKPVQGLASECLQYTFYGCIVWFVLHTNRLSR
jgi:hypothetical protein